MTKQQGCSTQRAQGGEVHSNRPARGGESGQFMPIEVPGGHGPCDYVGCLAGVCRQAILDDFVEDT